MPAASKIDATRYAVVVLPLVPVMPTTCMSRLGWPIERGRAGSASAQARIRRPSTHGTPASGRRGLLRHDGDRAALDRLLGERGAVGVQTLERDEHVARLRRGASRTQCR